MTDDLIARVLGIAARARADAAAADRAYTDSFIDGLRELGMGAYRCHVDLETGRTILEAGRRTPDRVVPPVPGRPDGLRETVIAGPGFGPSIAKRRKADV